MAKTLYDILELSPTASPEAIRAAYERLSRKFDPDLDAHQGKQDIRLRHDAVKEAFFTLGSPEKRRRYDRSLAPSSATYTSSLVDHEPFWTLPKIIAAILVLLIGVGWYMHVRHTEQKLAAEQAIAEARAKEAEAKAKAEAAAAMQERLAIQRQRELDRQRTYQEYRTRSEFERNRLEVERERQRQEMSERFAQERQKRELQSEARRRELERQRTEAVSIAEARRRAAREKEELCRIERERYGRSISC